MPTPVYTSLSVGDLMSLLAAKVGDRIAQGTNKVAGANLQDNTAPSGLAPFDTDNDALITDKWLTIYKGTRAGDSVRADSYTNSTFTITPLPAFGANLGTDSEYIIHERFSFRDYLQALQRAQRELNFDPVLGLGLMKEQVARHIVVGNALNNPTFDLYTTADAPDGWTTDANSTGTMQTTGTYAGARRCYQIVTGASQTGSVSQSLVEIGRYRGQSISVWAYVFATVASRVRLRVTDGVTTTNSSYHGGTGWERLEVNGFSVGANLTELTASIQVDTGASITVRMQVVWVPEEPPDYGRFQIVAAQNMVALDGYLTVLGNFNDAGGDVSRIHGWIGPDEWDVSYEATRRIRIFQPARWNEHVLEYRGWANHAALTAIGTSWAGPIEAILDVAAAILHEGKVSPQSQPSAATAGAPSGLVSVSAARKAALQHWGVRLGRRHKVVEPIQ